MKIVKALLLVALFVAPIAVWYFWPSEENRIRSLVRAEVAAFEAEDVEGFMKGISYNYSDKRGLSYLVIQRLLEREFAVRAGMKAEYRVREVLVVGERATATVEVRVIADEGGGRGYYYGDGPVEITLSLAKDAALRWRIESSAFARPEGGALPSALPAEEAGGAN